MTKTEWDLSQQLAATEEDAERLLAEYSLRLAEEATAPAPQADLLFEEVDSEIHTLKQTSAQLKRTLSKTTSVSEELESRLKDVRKSRKKRRLLKAAPANSVIDLAEEKQEHFAKGMNLYKVLLILIIGSFLGVVIEMLYCFATLGRIESRAGLVYGPFNLLYGVGAVALSLGLYRFRNHSSLISFAGGFVVGSVVEYVCSFLQEVAFGSRSWDYSHLPFNINGRICLLYSIFWGLLGILWIKNIYPRMAQLILKIPKKTGKIITWGMILFLAVNAVVTYAAVSRWSERIHGDPPSSVLEELIDLRFPDERMEWIFINMDFGQEQTPGQ